MDKKNYSYTYLIPLLASRVFLNRDILRCIKNTYMFSNIHVGIMCLVIVCNFDSLPNFSEIEERMISSSHYIESKDLDNGDTVYVYKFPEEYKGEYDAFMKGKYSTMKLEAKKRILSFWAEFYGNVPSFVTGPLLKMKHVLFKDKKYRLQLERELNVTLTDTVELGQQIDFGKEMYVFPVEEQAKT